MCLNVYAVGPVIDLTYEGIETKIAGAMNSALFDFAQ